MLLGIPEKDLEVAFRIFDRDKRQTITVNDFDNIMTSNPLSCNEGKEYTHIEDTNIFCI